MRLSRGLGRAGGTTNRHTQLWSSVAEDDDSEEARREEKHNGNSDHKDAVFDVSLANGAFVGAGPRGDNGTRASEFNTGDEALPVGLESLVFLAVGVTPSYA